MSPAPFSSVQFSCSVMSDSLQLLELQHTRPPCPSPTREAYSNSSQWWSSQLYHPTISSSVVPFSSHLQSSPASGSFQMSQFFTSGGQSITAPLPHSQWLGRLGSAVAQRQCLWLLGHSSCASCPVPIMMPQVANRFPQNIPFLLSFISPNNTFCGT